MTKEGHFQLFTIFEFLFSQRIACSTTLLFPFSFSSTAVLTLGSIIILFSLSVECTVCTVDGTDTPFLPYYCTSYFFLYPGPWLAPGIIIQVERACRIRMHEHETRDFFINYNFQLTVFKKKTERKSTLTQSIMAAVSTKKAQQQKGE